MTEKATLKAVETLILQFDLQIVSYLNEILIKTP